MSNSSNIDFLNNIEANNVSMAEIIKKYKLWKKPAYNELTKINAHNTNSTISPQHIINIYKQIYDYWYDYILSIGPKKFTPEQRDKIKAFLSMEKYKKENMTPEKCYSFIHYEYDTLLKGTGIRPAQSQANNQPPITNGGEVTTDFIHCMPFEQPKDIACRLYLNIKPEHICVLSEKLIKMCFDKRIRLYFKYWTKDNRNDTFLIYTNYEQIQDMINILKQIKKENPKIFEGCENINPLLTNIENFIGFGEEPKYKKSSFNDERASAIDEFSKDVVEKEIVKERKRIANYTDTISTSQGHSLSLENYLIYRLEQSFKETILQRQKDIVNRKYPRQYVRWGTKAISSYIEIENKIYRTCMNTLPPFVKQQIQEQAKQYLDGLRKGYNVFIKPIRFPTQNLDLFSPINRDIFNNDLNKNGHLDYEFYINLDMQEKLFSVFGSDKRIEKIITDEALAPYLAKHHVSSEHLSLNTETEKYLNQQNECLSHI